MPETLSRFRGAVWLPSPSEIGAAPVGDSRFDFVADYLIATNTALSGLTTSDGFTPTPGALVLLTGQSSAAQNGVWVVASGAWSRPANFNPAPQQTVRIKRGDSYAGARFTLANTGPATLGTTALTYQRTDNSVANAYTDQKFSASNSVAPNFKYGLDLIWVSSTQVTLTAGSAYQPSTGKIVTQSGPTTIAAGTAGLPNPLAANTLYYVYQIDDGRILCFTGGAFAPVAPYSSGAKTSANVTRRYLGSLLTNNTGGF